MKSAQEYAAALEAVYYDDGLDIEASWKETMPRAIERIIADAKAEAKAELLALAVRDCPDPDRLLAIHEWLDTTPRPDSEALTRAESWHSGIVYLLDVIEWLEARIAWLANETGFADEVAAAEKRGYERAVQEKMAAHPTLHALWGKAKDQPGYNKAEWMALQRQVEHAEAADSWGVLDL